jgi:pyruvate,water dikinase
MSEPSRIDGVRVPPGFCVTANAFERIMAAAAPSIDGPLDRLSRVDPAGRDSIDPQRGDPPDPGRDDDP